MCLNLHVYRSETNLRTSFRLSKLAHLLRPSCFLTNCRSKIYRLANSSCLFLRFRFGGILPRSNFHQQKLVYPNLLSFHQHTDHRILHHLANSQYLFHVACHQATNLHNRHHLHASMFPNPLLYRLPNLLHIRLRQRAPICRSH
jgi:hypothetical protein